MPVRPMMRPAKQVTVALHDLEQRVARAAADGTITSTEQRGIDRRAQHVEDLAQGLVREQGDGVVDAIDRLQRFSRRGTLELHADDVVKELVHERAELWRTAKADMHERPFAHLQHARAPFPGVRTRDFTWHGKRVHMVAVDLNNPKVKIGVTGPGERGRTAEQFARRRGAEIAINGDFFSLDGQYRPSGFNMKGGQAWGGRADGFEEALVFRKRHAEVVPGMRHVPDWARNALSARHLVVRDGHALTRREMVQRRPQPTEVAKIDEAAPRTAVGLSKDGRVLYLFAVDGTDEPDLGRLMRSQGVDIGFAMDSGSSAQMYQRGRGTVLRGRSGHMRAVANALFVQADR